MRYLKLFESKINNGVSRNVDIDDIFQELLDDFPQLGLEKIYIKATKTIIYRSKFESNDRKVLGRFHSQMIPYLEEINDRLEEIGLKCYLKIGGQHHGYYINIKVVKIESKF